MHVCLFIRIENKKQLENTEGKMEAKDILNNLFKQIELVLS